LLPTLGVSTAALLAFFVAAAVNYFLSVQILFRRKAKWSSLIEILVLSCVVAVVSLVDLYSTRFLVGTGLRPVLAKSAATAIGLGLNFAGRRLLVFPEKARPDWKPQG